MKEEKPRVEARRIEETIPVRSRRVIGPNGTHLALNVPCPVERRDVPLEACGVCGRCEGLRADPQTQAVEITCVRVTTDEPALEEVVHSKTAANTPISEIMTRQSVCITPDLAVASLGPVFLSMDVSGAAVVDKDGRPVGVLSQSDVLKWLYSLDADRVPSSVDQKVEALMATPALCLSEHESIAKASAFMAFEGIHRIPVVGERGQLVGMLSPLDILRWLARQDGYVLARQAPTSRLR